MKNGPLILFISNYASESPGGGIKTYVENLFGNLYSMNANLFIVARYGRRQQHNEKIIKGNSAMFILRTFLQCLKLKPTVIHSHANWYCIFPAVLYRALRNVRIIHTIHSIPEINYTWYTRLVFNWLLRRCDHLHFVSIFLREHYKSILQIDGQLSSIIYPGADHVPHIDANEKDQFLSRYPIKEGAFIILAHGLTAHLLKLQGALLLLDVFAKLLSEFPNTVLLFTRNGKYIDRLRQRAKELNVANSVMFTNELKKPAVANAVADIYAHITFGEGGVSLAVLEAMTAGNPIVATKTGGIPEILTDKQTALLVNAEPQAVYTAIKELILNQPLRELLSSNAQHYVRDRFTWKETAEHFMKLYKDLWTAPIEHKNQ